MKSEKLRIHVLDAETTNPGDLSWRGLEALGDLEVYSRTAPHDIRDRADGCEVVITNKTVLSRDLIADLPELELVCLLSTGANAVDLDACRERGVPVCNIPAYSTPSVAEHTLALMLARARGVESHDRAVHQGEWVDSADFCFTVTPQRELAGRTLGLVGFGDIARAVARIAVAFGMKVLSHTPHPEGKPDLGQAFVSMEDLLERSDVVSLHCPLTPETEKMINGESLKRMKSDAVLINTGRGGLVDEAALAAALENGTLGAALLDVLSTEPPKADNPLLTAPNCLITPHVAWATRAARSRLVEILVGNVEAFLAGRPRNLVNGV